MEAAPRAMNRFCLDTAGPACRDRREALRRAEIALKEQREAVAALRRGLPTDTPLPEDYEFAEAPSGGGEIRRVRLSGLFAPGGARLFVQHFMWAPEDAEPCPMCTLWADGYNAVLPHLARVAAFALVTKRDARIARRFADRRGWTGLRVLSSADSAFNADFGMETPDGRQLPGVSVFLRGEDGAPRHFYTASAIMGDGHYRGLDLLNPLWGLLDLLPEGRGDFMPRLDPEAPEAPAGSAP